MENIQHQINQFSVNEEVYSIRNEMYGTVKSIDIYHEHNNEYIHGYVISFSEDNFDYEYHYPNEISKNKPIN